jgi:hypothetical protein
MARLFITPRELDFISDLTKEIIKDISGQKIYYYRVLNDESDIHEVYEESQSKVFDVPIEIDARVEYLAPEIRTGKFGTEQFFSLNVYIHERDMNDRDLDINIGDYFSYGQVFFEITSAVNDVSIYGQIEHFSGIKITAKQARLGLIDIVPHGPINAKYSADEDSVQDKFVQQRGFAENELGVTDDKRELIENGVLDQPLSGPSKVTPESSSPGVGSAFYDEQ